MTFAIYDGYGKSVRISKKLTNSPNKIISKITTIQISTLFLNHEFCHHFSWGNFRTLIRRRKSLEKAQGKIKKACEFSSGNRLRKRLSSCTHQVPPCSIDIASRIWLYHRSKGMSVLVSIFVAIAKQHCGKTILCTQILLASYEEATNLPLLPLIHEFIYKIEKGNSPKALFSQGLLPKLPN